MGVGPSRDQSHHHPRLRRVFAKELETVERILSRVLTKDNKFVEAGYNFLTKDTCDKYSMVLESQLKKHLRVDVQALHDAVVLVPQQERVKVGAQVVNKAELCEVVSKHYIKILYLLCLVKYVYNLEHAGDHSLAGIIARNVRMVGKDLLEINYCSIPQKNYARQDKKIDFQSMQGLTFVLDHFLMPAERSTFLKQFKTLFARVPLVLDYAALSRTACTDPLLSPSDYAALYGKDRIVCRAPSAPLADADAGHEDTLFQVGALNPVLSTNMCMAKKKLVVPLGKDKASAQLRQLHDAMLANYGANVYRIEKEVLARLVVEASGGQYSLRPVADEELMETVLAAKRIVLQFYLQSIIDYQRLLDYAMTLPTAKMDA